MATSSTGTNSLVDDFEESFQVFDLCPLVVQMCLQFGCLQECVHALTKQEAATGVEKDEISMEVDLTTMKFIDLARQMEAFFIHKRMLLSALKPHLVLEEENLDLRWEITRKNEMIKKHYDSIERWKNMLSETPPQHIPQQAPPLQMPPQVCPSYYYRQSWLFMCTFQAPMGAIPQGGMPHGAMMGNPMNMPHPSHGGLGPGPGVPMPGMAMQVLAIYTTGHT